MLHLSIIFRQAPKTGSLSGPINILEGVPDAFIVQATPTYNLIARKQSVLLEQVSPYVGGKKIFKQMVLSHAYADHLHTGDCLATCTSRAFNLLISSEQTAVSKAKTDQLRRKKARERTTRRLGAQADLSDEEADIKQISFYDVALETDLCKPIEESIVIQRAIGELTPEEQEIIYLYYAEELPIREIAKLLGMTKSTVHDVKKRAERALKSIIGDTTATSF